MTRRISGRWLGWLGGLWLACLGCSPRAADVGPEGPGPLDDRGRDAIGAYIEGYNLLGVAVGGLAAAYEQAVPLDGPATDPPNLGSVRLPPVPAELGANLNRARQEFEAAKREAPESLAHLAPLADRLRVASRRVMKTYAEAQHHFQNGQPKSDQGAAAKKYHQEMVTRVAEFRAALGALGQALDELDARQLQAEIDALASAKGSGYWFRRGNQAAKRLLTAARGLPKAQAAFAAEVAGLSLLLSELKAVDASSAFGAYLEAFVDLQTVAGRLQSAATAGSPAELEAARLDLSRAHNRVIQASETLYDLEVKAPPAP